jgi:hypothetical protein
MAGKSQYPCGLQHDQLLKITHTFPRRALIKKSMNDPNSYEHEETVYWDKGDHLIVRTTFRGKNAFGGVVKNSIMAKVDLNGNVIEIISEGP